MFNIYTYERQLFENFQKRKGEKLRKQFMMRRKKKLEEYSKKYEKRMKNFIFSLCEKPVLLRKSPSENLLNKTFDGKNFIFGEYKTEKQRLQEREAYKNELNKYDKQRKDIDKKRSLLKVKNNRDYLLIQPEMRFTSKTKLEKIIDNLKKDSMFVADVSAPSILEKIKKNKFNKPKKIKEFYNLIDKSYLNDNDIKRTIKEMNEIEQDQKDNKYTMRNYFAWKYFHIISNNNYKKVNKTVNDINVKDVLQLMGNEDTKSKVRNEFEGLVKNGIKTYFKGSSEYVQLKELKENNFHNSKNETERNEKKKDEIQKSINNEIIYAIKLESRKKKILKEAIPKGKIKSKTARNISVKNNQRKKRPSSIIDLNSKLTNISKQKKSNDLSKKEYSLKDLNEELRKKKIMMNSLIDNEINNSISKDFMNKYHSINLYGELVKFPKDCELPEDLNFLEIKKDKFLKEKLKNLLGHIEAEKRKINDEKYKQFVKKFSRSLFGFKGRKLKTNMDEIKLENKLDYIVIDGKPFLKKDLKTISDIVFKKCNYYTMKKTQTV